jgi:transcriptional regulator with XRE-family HTH domain
VTVARRTRTHFLGGDDQTPTGLKPKHLTKQEFGRRVYRLMIEKGWNQSELARQAGLTRDAISKYINGLSLPAPQSLEGLAKALDVEPTELLPNYVESAIEHDNPAVNLRVSGADMTKAWLTINRLVSYATGAAIIELLRRDDVLEGFEENNNNHASNRA